MVWLNKKVLDGKFKTTHKVELDVVVFIKDDNKLLLEIKPEVFKP